jgi:hypothetical protein
MRDWYPIADGVLFNKSALLDANLRTDTGYGTVRFSAWM